MICLMCGEEVRDDAKFCKACGSSLEMQGKCANRKPLYIAVGTVAGFITVALIAFIIVASNNSKDHRISSCSENVFYEESTENSTICRLSPSSYEGDVCAPETCVPEDDFCDNGENVIQNNEEAYGTFIGTVRFHSGSDAIDPVVGGIDGDCYYLEFDGEETFWAYDIEYENGTYQKSDNKIYLSGDDRLSQYIGQRVVIEGTAATTVRGRICVSIDSMRKE